MEFLINRPLPSGSTRSLLLVSSVAVVGKTGVYLHHNLNYCDNDQYVNRDQIPEAARKQKKNPQFNFQRSFIYYQ